MRLLRFVLPLLVVSGCLGAGPGSLTDGAESGPETPNPNDMVSNSSVDATVDFLIDGPMTLQVPVGPVRSYRLVSNESFLLDRTAGYGTPGNGIRGWWLLVVPEDFSVSASDDCEPVQDSVRFYGSWLEQGNVNWEFGAGAWRLYAWVASGTHALVRFNGHEQWQEDSRTFNGTTLELATNGTRWQSGPDSGPPAYAIDHSEALPSETRIWAFSAFEPSFLSAPLGGQTHSAYVVDEQECGAAEGDSGGFGGDDTITLAGQVRPGATSAWRLEYRGDVGSPYFSAVTSSLVYLQVPPELVVG